MEQKKILTIPYDINFTVEVLKKCISSVPEQIIDEVKSSELAGRGGAGFPTGLKWAFLKSVQSDEKFIIANAEEGEPATFKDRLLLSKFPYKLIDGMIIASIAISAEKGFIYLNDRYKKEKILLEKTISLYREKGLLGENVLSSNKNFNIEIIESIGRYITGEETSLCNVIEGKRPFPRLKPPYPGEKGIYNKPTLINNVETLSFIPHIIANGGKWFRNFGVEGSYGTKLICLSGDVKKAVHEIEMGKLTIKEILKQYGKIKNINSIKAVLPSASGSFIPPGKFSINYDFRSLLKNGMSLGTGGMIVYNKKRNLLKEIKKLMAFYKEESCGYCVPCRIGTQRIYEMLENEEFKDSIDMLEELAKTMNKISRCALGQTCVNPLLSYINLYKSGQN